MNIVRKFLETEMPPEAIEKFNKENNLNLKPGDTFKDAMDFVILREAKAGNQEFIELAKKYDIKE